jgi:hypothetical protein
MKSRRFMPDMVSPTPVRWVSRALSLARGNPAGPLGDPESFSLLPDPTSVDGLYAAGDVVSDLHQLSVAEGHAAIAATMIHNSLPRNFR